MENSQIVRAGNTGRTVGIMTEPWTVLQNAVRLTNSSSGIPYALARLVNDNRNLVRLVFSAGGAVRTVPRIGTDLLGSRVRDMVSPRWLYLDITMKHPQRPMPLGITFALCNRVLNETEFSVKGVYATSGQQLGNWDWGQKNILRRLGMAETWSRIVGSCAPSFGTFVHDEMLLGETDFMVGAVKDEYIFPDAFDSTDMGRVEGLLETLGASYVTSGTNCDRIRERMLLVNAASGFKQANEPGDKNERDEQRDRDSDSVRGMYAVYAGNFR